MRFVKTRLNIKLDVFWNGLRELGYAGRQNRNDGLAFKRWTPIRFIAEGKCSYDFACSEMNPMPSFKQKCNSGSGGNI